VPVEVVQFLLKLLLKHNSCCVPRFLLLVATKLLTVKLYSCYAKESEILERSDILPPTPQT